MPASNIKNHRKQVTLSAALGKASDHNGPCRGRTLSVLFARDRNGVKIMSVACEACAAPQHCTRPTTAGGRHGRLANVLTPAGWRCWECAQSDGFWSETTDGFAKLLCGW